MIVLSSTLTTILAHGQKSSDVSDTFKFHILRCRVAVHIWRSCPNFVERHRQRGLQSNVYPASASSQVNSTLEGPPRRWFHRNGYAVTNISIGLRIRISVSISVGVSVSVSESTSMSVSVSWPVSASAFQYHRQHRRHAGSVNEKI